MILINVELLKLKKRFKLEVPLTSTFLQLSELVFKTFNLNKTDFENGSSKLLFIYKCIACKYERTIESYQIDNNSTIYISIPKQIYDSFSYAVQNKQPKSLYQSTPKNHTEISLKTVEEKDEEDSLKNQIMVQNYANKDILNKLVEFGYNELDAAYAIAYKNVLEGAIEFLDLGVTSDLYIRRCIEKIVKAKLTQKTDDILRYSIEIIKVECAKRGENAEVSVAAAIGIFSMNIKIQDPNYLAELKEFTKKVEQKYPGQAPQLIQAQFSQMNANPKYNQIYREFYCQDQNSNQFNGQNMNLFYYGQNQGLNSYSYSQNQKATIEVKKKFWEIFDRLPTMNPQNFINPFEETSKYIEMAKISFQKDFLYSYGEKLNYEQLMFLYRMKTERNIKISVSINYLSTANGNVKGAETLISRYK